MQCTTIFVVAHFTSGLWVPLPSSCYKQEGHKVKSDWTLIPVFTLRVFMVRWSKCGTCVCVWVCMCVCACVSPKYELATFPACVLSVQHGSCKQRKAVTENGWRVCVADRHILFEFMVATPRRQNLKFLNLRCGHTNRLLWLMSTLQGLALPVARQAHFSGECPRERWRSRTVNDGEK